MEERSQEGRNGCAIPPRNVEPAGNASFWKQMQPGAARRLENLVYGIMVSLSQDRSGELERCLGVAVMLFAYE